jgi:membrane-bound lytic murein transglycosylase D
MHQARLALLLTALLAAGCASQPGTTAPSEPSTTDSKAPAATAPGAGKTEKANDTDDQLIAVREYGNIWERIRAGYTMPPLDSPLVGVHERWFANNPEYIERMVDRARLYLFYIVEEVEKRNMPMEIALLPAIESAYIPHAYSRARAAGLWQFIPSTGKIYGLDMNWWYDGRRDVIESTRAALNYLEKLHNQFGDWQLALAAYNCGEGKVEYHVNRNLRNGQPGNYVSLTRLPKETRNYVPKLMAMVNIVSDPAKYGLQLAHIPNTEYFAKVETDGQIDLGVVARLTDMPINDLFMINPGYQRWITNPKGTTALLVPADKKDALIEGLSKLSDEERVQWARHQVKRGDTMSRIATHYNVTVEAIRTANSLPNNLLNVGQNLLIPVSANKAALAAIKPPAIIRTAAAAISQKGNRVKVVHQVRNGESLWTIARKYHTSIQQLREWNLLEEGEVLRMGQRLFIWTTRGASTSAHLGLNPG